MNLKKIEAVNQAMTSATSDQIFSGASLHISSQFQTIYNGHFGSTQYVNGRPINSQTIYDLASLTKPLATSLAILHMQESGQISLDQKLSDFFPKKWLIQKDEITIQHLLCHNSGFPAHRPFFEQLRTLPKIDRSSELLRMILSEPLIHPIGVKTIYSDLGFMLLHIIIEKITGSPLNKYVEKNIYLPLGLNNLFFIDKSIEKKDNFAATENCPWRKKTLIAEVHDDNASVLGGICGHAGLFGNLADVSRLLQILLEIYHSHPDSNSLQQVISTPGLQSFMQVPEDAERALGFDIPTPPNSSSGQYFSNNSVGHLGFTGTSFWMDLDRSIIIVLLTNRVHPDRNNTKIRQFRPIIHDLIMRKLVGEKKTNHL